MAGQKLLLPYNFTPQDKKALDFVVQNFGRDKDLSVALFHAYTAVPEIQVSKSEITSKLRENMSYMSQQISENERELEKARKYLLENGLKPESVKCVFKARKKGGGCGNPGLCQDREGGHHRLEPPVRGNQALFHGKHVQQGRGGGAQCHGEHRDLTLSLFSRARLGNLS